MLSIFGQRERPNYSARQSVFHLRRCFLFILCAHNISTDMLIQTESSLYYTCIARNREYIVIFMHVWSTAPGQACLSLFGGVCSQMLPPSNYFYIHLSARLDASPAFGCLNGLAYIAKGKGYKCRIGVSRNFRACAYVRCAPARRY